MTGAEALEKILETIQKLDIEIADIKTSVKLIEANIKVLNNRAAGLIKKTEEENNIKQKTNDITATLPLPQNVVQENNNANQQHTSLRNTRITNTATLPATNKQQPLNDPPGTMIYKKVYGRLIDGNNNPIDGVLIKIYDKNNEVCATAESDAAGYWESMVKIGKYIAEYTKDHFKTENKSFEVKKQNKEVLVG